MALVYFKGSYPAGHFTLKNGTEGEPWYVVTI